MKFSACIEWLFAEEAPDFADRIRAASDAGLDGVEFWRWTNKDLDAIEGALKETGLPLAGIVAEPMIPLTDPGRHDEFLEGLDASIRTARRLGAPVLIAQTGALLDTPREAQRRALVDCLSGAADRLVGTGVVLAIEPLNTRVDHPGYFLFRPWRVSTSSTPSTARRSGSSMTSTTPRSWTRRSRRSSNDGSTASPTSTSPTAPAAASREAAASTGRPA